MGWILGGLRQTDCSQSYTLQGNFPQSECNKISLGKEYQITYSLNNRKKQNFYFYQICIRTTENTGYIDLLL